jgi:acetylglutamate kinase
LTIFSTICSADHGGPAGAIVKLVIRINDADFSQTLLSVQIARALAELLEEKHSVMIVHGNSHEPQYGTSNGSSNGNAHKQVPVAAEQIDPELPSVNQLNKNMVARLAALGIPAFGLCGADGNLVRTRDKIPCNNTLWSNSAFKFEVAAVNPWWLELITKNGGVPVLSNVALKPDMQYCMIEADHLAANCSIAWKADALIFLTREDGIRDPDGNVVRWFDASQLADPLCSSSLPRHLLSQLSAGFHVLRNGVKRARILPVAHSRSLSSFYSIRIDSGTEVILASP